MTGAGRREDGPCVGRIGGKRDLGCLGQVRICAENRTHLRPTGRVASVTGNEGSDSPVPSGAGRASVRTHSARAGRCPSAAPGRRGSNARVASADRATRPFERAARRCLDRRQAEPARPARYKAPALAGALAAASRSHAKAAGSTGLCSRVALPIAVMGRDGSTQDGRFKFWPPPRAWRRRARSRRIC